MGNLIYSAIASLDGYVEDQEGRFEWAAPDEELLAFVNDLERPAGTHLYGRRMYETLAVWETLGRSTADSPVTRDFAEIWRAAEKVVYSRTLQSVATARTHLERDFETEAVRRLKDSAERDVTIGGAELAGRALAAGLLGECHLLLHPIVVGAGKRALPDGVRCGLELLEERRFGSGVVCLSYRVGG